MTTLAKIEKLAKEGKTRSEIAGELNMGYSKVASLIVSNGITCQRKAYSSTKRLKRREEIAMHAISRPYDSNAFTLDKVADHAGVTKQRVNQVLDMFGLKFSEIKSEAKNAREQTLEKIINIVYAVMLQKIEKEKGWAYMKAFDYRHILQLRSQSRSFDKYHKFFQVYEGAVLAGASLSYNEIEMISGVPRTQIGEILKRSGLEPLGRRKNEHTRD